MTGPSGRKRDGSIASLFTLTGKPPGVKPPAVTAPGVQAPDVKPGMAGLAAGDPWHDLALMTACLAFQTDAAGVFTLVEPDPTLGWTAAALLGQSSDLIRGEPGGWDPAFNPFRPLAPARHRRGWIKRADGGMTCLSFSVIPLTDSEGRIIGARGLGVALADLDRIAGEAASATRRADVLDRLLRELRVEMLPARMLQQALRALIDAIGAEGALVIDAAAEGKPLLHEVGGDSGPVLAAACDQLRFGLAPPAVATVVLERPVILCDCRSRFGGQIGLVLWRRDGARRWTDDDRAIAGSAANLVRVLIEHEFVQNDIAARSRHDPLTGLPNRRAFGEEVARRIDRLDRDRHPGTMMLIDLDRFRSFNDQFGHDTGDEVLRVMSALLRTTFRPADMVARLNGDQFGIWMDGADAMTAAERAEALCQDGIHQFSHLGAEQVGLGISIGIAMRWPDGGEDGEELGRRTALALAQAKQAGGRGWRSWS